jgi:hypothetical protein
MMVKHLLELEPFLSFSPNLSQKELERHNFQVQTNVLFGTLKKEMKYVEEYFRVGEQIACLGVVRDGGNHSRATENLPAPQQQFPQHQQLMPPRHLL